MDLHFYVIKVLCLYSCCQIFSGGCFVAYCYINTFVVCQSLFKTASEILSQHNQQVSSTDQKVQNCRYGSLRLKAEFNLSTSKKSSSLLTIK